MCSTVRPIQCQCHNAGAGASAASSNAQRWYLATPVQGSRSVLSENDGGYCQRCHLQSTPGGSGSKYCYPDAAVHNDSNTRGMFFDVQLEFVAVSTDIKRLLCHCITRKRS